MQPPSQNKFDEQKKIFFCEGDWDVSHLPRLKTSLNQIPTKIESLTINGQNIKKMDSAGAWLLDKWQKKRKTQGVEIKLQDFAEDHQALIAMIDKNLKDEVKLAKPKPKNFFYFVGQFTVEQSRELYQYLGFIGLLFYEGLRIVRKPHRFRVNAVSSVIYRTGVQALPIIALLSFMIGVVITYQLGVQLRNYGANAFIVDLVGIAVLREFGPLLTAIMVAGRTGSAFTAQLGMMKINQEIDALNTMGVTPAELLLLPRILGLFIALPLLTVWADVFGVMGGMAMAHGMMDVTWYEFLHRFPHAVKLKNLLIGLGKAPVFAIIIATIGCFQGMRVKGSADSVGQNTTRSVVLSIFFIIVADAVFSIVFSIMKL
ncbi:MAG: ABC transporter permease [Gammaproteobacteria bacterium]|nr:ABC transporter permease [Gammaproteobacteria bacterium]